MVEAIVLVHLTVAWAPSWVACPISAQLIVFQKECTTNFMLFIKEFDTNDLVALCEGCSLHKKEDT